MHPWPRITAKQPTMATLQAINSSQYDSIVSSRYTKWITKRCNIRANDFYVSNQLETQNNMPNKHLFFCTVLISSILINTEAWGQQKDSATNDIYTALTWSLSKNFDPVAYTFHDQYDLTLIASVIYLLGDRKTTSFKLYRNSDSQLEDVCDVVEKLNHINWMFDDQPVQMISACGIDSSGPVILTGVASTARGNDYVNSLFLRSTVAINISIPSIGGQRMQMPVSASGFTALWNNMKEPL